MAPRPKKKASSTTQPEHERLRGQFTWRVSPEVLERVKQEAKLERLPVTDYLVETLLLQWARERAERSSQRSSRT